MSINVRVTGIRVPDEKPAGPGPSTVLVADGVRDDTGMPLSFAGESRMMWDIQHALDEGIMVIAVIEPWQIVGHN